MDEIVDALAATSLFAGLKKGPLELIARATKLLALPPGQVLIEQGQNMTHMSIIKSGEALVTVDGSEVGRVGPGDVVGELSLIDEAPASATVTFPDGGAVWHLARTGFVPVWNKHRDEVSTAMLLAVTEKLRQTNKLVAD